MVSQAATARQPGHNKSFRPETDRPRVKTIAGWEERGGRRCEKQDGVIKSVRVEMGREERGNGRG